MKYEHSFDDTDGFGRIEKTAIGTGVIKPNSPVFLNRLLSPLGQYDPNAPHPGREFTERERRAIEEAEKEYEEIHRRHHP